VTTAQNRISDVEIGVSLVTDLTRPLLVGFDAVGPPLPFLNACCDQQHVIQWNRPVIYCAFPSGLVCI
jgi:hypothetical protein